MAHQANSIATDDPIFPVIRLDGSGRIIGRNARAEERLGAAATDPDHDDLRRFSSDAESDLVLARLVARMAKGLKQVEELVQLSIQGLPSWVALSACRVAESSDGDYVYDVLLTFIDEARASLAGHDRVSHSEARLSAALDAAAAGLVSIDEKGRITTFNATAGTLFGWERREILGRNVKILLPPEEAAEHDGFLRRYLETGEARIIGRPRRVFGRHRDGSAIPIEISISESRFEGRLIFTAIIRDLREQDALLAHLETKTARLEATQRAARAGHWDWDLLEDRWTWSIESLQILGRGRNDAPTSLAAFLEIVHADEHGLVKAALESGLAGEESARLEYRIRRPSGEWRWCRHGSRLFSNALGCPRLLMGTLVDVTDEVRAREERGRLEQQIMQCQRIETIGTFAGGIAHEFNNLLVPILGFTQLTLEQVRDDSDLSHMLELVIGSARRASDLVSRLLMMSREHEAAVVPTHLTDIVRGSIELLEAARPEQIQIESNIEQVLAQVLVDPVQIQQVILNIGMNALQAMAELPRGRLEIEIRETQVDAELARIHRQLEPGPHAEILIRDTGPGISASVMPRIFEPFFTTKPVGKGTGLGLSVAHGIISRQSGAIVVSCPSGGGTTFSVLLPFAAKATDDLAKAESKRLLLIEGDAAVRDCIERVLRREGHEVESFAIPSEAIAALARDRREDHALILVGMRLPEMSGIELLWSLRRQGCSAPAVILTGSTRPSPDQLIAAGVVRVIQKPVEIQAIAGILSELIASVG